jgi:hypothetical protein
MMKNNDDEHNQHKEENLAQLKDRIHCILCISGKRKSGKGKL